MKFVCDVNISLKVTKWLSSQSDGAEHVNNIFADPETPDQKIIEYADLTESIVVTHDYDYQANFNVYKKPRQIIFLKTKNIIDSQLKYLFERNRTDFKEVLKQNPICLIEVHSIEEWYYFIPSPQDL